MWITSLRELRDSWTYFCRTMIEIDKCHFSVCNYLTLLWNSKTSLSQPLCKRFSTAYDSCKVLSDLVISFELCWLALLPFYCCEMLVVNSLSSTVIPHPLQLHPIPVLKMSNHPSWPLDALNIQADLVAPVIHGFAFSCIIPMMFSIDY